MKKKINKMYVITFFVLLISVVCSGLFTEVLGDKSSVVEKRLLKAYNADQDYIKLNRKVVIVKIPYEEVEERNRKVLESYNTQLTNKIRPMINRLFSGAEGIFLLERSDLNNVEAGNTNVSFLRSRDNIYWHYSSANAVYYQNDDRCGLIEEYDSPVEDTTEGIHLFADADRNQVYLPMYYLRMQGYQVFYDAGQQRYELQRMGKKTQYLYTDEGGMIPVRRADYRNVETYELSDLYDKQDTLNADYFKDAVILFENVPFAAAGTTSYSEYDSIAYRYVDAMATLDAKATVPFLTSHWETLLVMGSVFICGMLAIHCPNLFGVFLQMAYLVSLLLVQRILYVRGTIYIPVFTSVVFTELVFWSLFIFRRFVIRWNKKTLPIDAVINFSKSVVDLEEAYTYADYLLKNRTEIENAISASILLPIADRDSFIIKELAGEKHRNAKLLEEQIQGKKGTKKVVQVRTKLFENIRYLTFIPLPIFDKVEDEQTYTVLGSRHQLGSQAANYISMLLFSVYIYFKAQHERGKHQRVYFSMLSLMISVIDAKDPVTAGHSQRVADISKDIGKWLKLNAKEQYDLEFTALLHDIGKIGVSDYVLNKPSVYTQNDFEQMKHHTVRGAEMLAEVGVSQQVIDGVRHHHERMDGRGYPDGVTGEKLNLFARIIKIADVYDALTSKRQYKEAWKVDKALDIIYQGRGTEFDKDIADVFIEHMRPAGWEPPVKEKKKLYEKDPMLKKVRDIAEDFYARYHDYIAIGYPIPSRKAESVDLISQNGFMGFDWGETFSNAKFLENKPVILSYEKDTQSLLFGQCCGKDGIAHVYYYFFRGFINMGMYLLNGTQDMQILEELQNYFGHPVELGTGLSIYSGRKFRIVHMTSYDGKDILFYISDYMCANYVFEQVQSDVG